MDYKDHYCCWEQLDNEDSDIEKETVPACGQAIAHLKCCLCEKLNPKVEWK